LAKIYLMVGGLFYTMCIRDLFLNFHFFKFIILIFVIKSFIQNMLREEKSVYKRAISSSHRMKSEVENRNFNGIL